MPASHPKIGAAPANMPIPSRLNCILVVLVTGTVIGLLWCASHVESWWLIVTIGILCSYVLLTNYALLHEAAHGNLHENSIWNYVLGFLAGCLFPMPLTLMRSTHQGHHLRNRTDFEMFDLYYPHDSRFIRYVQWYGILCGLFWPWIPIGAVLFAVCPGVLRVRVWKTARSSHHILGDIRGRILTLIRIETLAIVGCWVMLFWLIELRWPAVLAAYACFSLNWSTRQYVGHAYSQRHVIEGAWNLKHLPWMSWLLLHNEYDLNHHRHPEVSWIYLPQLTRADEVRQNYFSQYWRQWRGPRLCEEPAPESLQELPLSIHQT